MSSTASSPGQRDKMWILNIFGGLFFACLAWWSYSKITRFETGGGFLHLPKPLMLLYDLIGMWGVVGFWLLLVAYNIVSGTMTAIKERKSI
jgi:Na+-driven multidrug efflux pump